MSRILIGISGIALSFVLSGCSRVSPPPSESAGVTVRQTVDAPPPTASEVGAALQAKEKPWRVKNTTNDNN